MPPWWTSSEIEERKNSCRKFFSSMVTGGGIRVKRGVPSPSASRRDCPQSESVSGRLNPAACAVTTSALTPRSRFLRKAKEFHPLRAPETQSSNRPSPVSPSSDSLRLPSGYLTSQKSMRRASQTVLRNQGDWLALPAPVEPQHPSNAGELTRREHWAAVSAIPWSHPLLRSKDLTPLFPIGTFVVACPWRLEPNLCLARSPTLARNFRPSDSCLHAKRQSSRAGSLRGSLWFVVEGSVLNRASLLKSLTCLFCSLRSARSQENLVRVV